jgi:hypothetical protein
LKCPKCGAEIPWGRKFCGECGHGLREAKGLPAIDYSKPQSYTPKVLADKILASRRSMEGERPKNSQARRTMEGPQAVSAEGRPAAKGKGGPARGTRRLRTPTPASPSAGRISCRSSSRTPSSCMHSPCSPARRSLAHRLACNRS